MNEAPHSTYMYPPPPPGYETWRGAAPAAPAESPPTYPPFQNQGAAYSAPPAYYPPYPGYNVPPQPYPYYTPVPQQRKGWIWAVVIGVGVLLVGCVSLVVIGFAVINGYREDGTKTVEVFMKAASTRNTEQMYQQLSSTGKAAFTRRTLQDYVTQRGTYLSKYKSLSSDDIDVNTGTGRNITLSLGGNIVYTDGRSSRFSARLTQENDNWLIDTFTLDPPK